MPAPDTMGVHTPGPWVIQDNAAHGIHIYGPGGPFGGGKHLARASNSAGVDVLANARLIAAAPAMLTALHDLLTQHVNELTAHGTPVEAIEAAPEVVAARAAIAAARGEAS